MLLNKKLLMLTHLSNWEGNRETLPREICWSSWPTSFSMAAKMLMLAQNFCPAKMLISKRTIYGKTSKVSWRMRCDRSLRNSAYFLAKRSPLRPLPTCTESHKSSVGSPPLEVSVLSCIHEMFCKLFVHSLLRPLRSCSKNTTHSSFVKILIDLSWFDCKKIENKGFFVLLKRALPLAALASTAFLHLLDLVRDPFPLLQLRCWEDLWGGFRY